MVGYKREVARREREGRGFYRHAKSTLKQRNKKKLLEKTTWYRDRVRDDGDENVMGMPQSVGRGKGWKKEKKDAESKKGNKGVEVKAVMFVPFTTGSKLAKEIREAEEKHDWLQAQSGGEVWRQVGGSPYQIQSLARNGLWEEDVPIMSDQTENRE